MFNRKAMHLAGVALLVLPAPSAGARTLATTEDEGESNRGRHSSQETISYTDCEQQIGVFPVDAVDVTGYLPDGFAPVAFQDSSPVGPTGAPSPSAASGAVQLTATFCRSASTAATRSEPVTVLQAWIYVDPPDHLKGDGINAYVVVPWLAVSQKKETRAFRALGLPAVHAKVSSSIEGVIAGPLASGTAGAATKEFAVDLATIVPGVIRDTTPERIRLFGVNVRKDGATLAGVVDMDEQPHTHVLIGTANMQATGAAPFPLAETQGVALHVDPGYGVSWMRSTTPFGP